VGKEALSPEKLLRISSRLTWPHLIGSTELFAMFIHNPVALPKCLIISKTLSTSCLVGFTNRTAS
jgi:hypothetical protein